MIFDCHTHTKFSFDSEMSAVEAIETAKNLNIGIIFTEHFDFDLEKFQFEPQEYFGEYKNFRGENVRLGVEIGLTSTSVQANKNFIAQGNFDLVIGSIHLIDNLDIYYPEFFADRDKISTYKKYFETMKENILIHDFDVLGHIDYICRAAPYENPGLDYEIFSADIDEILKILIEREKILELNTRRLDKKSVLNELAPIYKKYRELGGKFISIGSDAHKISAIGNYFDTAKKFADDLNLIPVTFRDRKILLTD